MVAESASGADAVLGILTLAGGIAYIRLSVRNKKEQEE